MNEINKLLSKVKITQDLNEQKYSQIILPIKGIPTQSINNYQNISQIKSQYSPGASPNTKYKETKPTSKYITWYKNGQIMSEAIYKDGECISGDCD